VVEDPVALLLVLVPEVELPEVEVLLDTSDSARRPPWTVGGTVVALTFLAAAR
jgi:hypothetical protein